MLPGSAVAWPFAAGGAVSERLQWLTDGLDPVRGMETTRQLRDTPRVVVEFDGLESAANRRWMENQLSAHGAHLWHVPLLADSTATLAAAAPGDSVLAVPTAARRFVAQGNAMLLDPSDPRRYEVLELAGVADGLLTIDGELIGTWPAGSLIVPTAGGYLDNPPQLQRFTADAAPYSVAFRLAHPQDWPADFGPITYRDLPVLDVPVFWTQDPTYVPARALQRVSDQIGPDRVLDAAGVPLPEITLEATLVNAGEIATHRSLLYALAGRQHPIWVPSMARDFVVQAVASSTLLDVEWCGFSAAPLRDNRRDIRIARHGQPDLYRRIVAAAEVDEATERLALDAPLPGGLEADDIAGMSFLALCRQTSDVNALRVWSHGVVQSTLSFKGCNHGL